MSERDLPRNCLGCGKLHVTIEMHSVTLLSCYFSFNREMQVSNDTSDTFCNMKLSGRKMSDSQRA